MIKNQIAIWKSIKRINQLRANTRYYNFKHPGRYKETYTKQNHKNLKLKKCKCGCKKLTYRKWAVGHYAKLHPNPENLGIYLGNNPNYKRGKENPNWKGGIIISDGYKYIYKPKHPNATKQGYILEHRLIMETHIKRFLTKTEVVHHGNGNTLDNRFENLALQKNQAEHNHNCHNHNRDEQGRFVTMR